MLLRMRLGTSKYFEAPKRIQSKIVLKKQLRYFKFFWGGQGGHTETDRKCFKVNSYTRTSKKNLSSNAFGCFEVLRSSETHSKYNFGPNNCIVCVCVCGGVKCRQAQSDSSYALTFQVNHACDMVLKITYFWWHNGSDPEVLDYFTHISPRFSISRELVQSSLEVQHRSLWPQSQLIQKRSPLLVWGCEFADEELAPLHHGPLIMSISAIG